MTDNANNLPIIGNSVFFEVAGIKDVPAKIDTGASVSAIWATNIKMNAQNELEFTLFAPGSEYYTGEVIKTDEYQVRRVRSSTGHDQIRYMVKLSARLKGRKIRINFTLANRKINKFPVLIGAKTLRGKFLVNVSDREIAIPNRTERTLNEQLQADPQAFHRKYMEPLADAQVANRPADAQVSHQKHPEQLS